MSSSKAPKQAPEGDIGATKEDLELFRRFMRVARLLQAQDTDDELAPDAPPRDNAPNQSRETRRNEDLEMGDDQDQDQDPGRESNEDADGEPDDADGAITLAPPPGRARARKSPGSEAGSKRKRSLNLDVDMNSDASSGRRTSVQTPKQSTASPRPRLAPNNALASDNGPPSNGLASDRGAPQQALQQQSKPPRHHAAVEKRYRSVLNSKIQQLRAAIPATNNFNVDGDGNVTGLDENDTNKPPTKSVVMDRAIQYMNFLVSTFEGYEAERNELRQKLQFWLDEVPALDGPEGQIGMRPSSQHGDARGEGIGAVFLGA